MFGCWCLVILLSGCFVVCLEDSTTLLCSFAFGSVRTRSKGSRIKPMRRICSFTDFYCVVGFLCACGALGLSRITSCRRNLAPHRRKYNPKEILYNIQDQIKEIREKIKSVASVICELFERVRTEPKAKEHNNVVLSSILNKGNR